MNNLFTLIKKELLEQSRTKRTLLFLVVFLFVALASPIFAKLMPIILKSIDVPGITIKLPTPTYMDSLDQFIKNISQLATFIVIFIVAGAISDEKSNKTLEMVITKPISRENFILAKFISYSLNFTVIFIATSAIFYIYTVSLLGGFSLAHFAIIVGCILLYSLMCIAITICASTFLKNAIAAAGFGFLLVFILEPILNLLKVVGHYSPNLLISSYRSIVANGFTTDLIRPILTTILIILTSITVSLVLFKKQEIER